MTKQVEPGFPEVDDPNKVNTNEDFKIQYRRYTHRDNPTVEIINPIVINASLRANVQEETGKQTVAMSFMTEYFSKNILQQLLNGEPNPRDRENIVYKMIINRVDLISCLIFMGSRRTGTPTLADGYEDTPTYLSGITVTRVVLDIEEALIDSVVINAKATVKTLGQDAYYYVTKTYFVNGDGKLGNTLRVLPSQELINRKKRTGLSMKGASSRTSPARTRGDSRES